MAAGRCPAKSARSHALNTRNRPLFSAPLYCDIHDFGGTWGGRWVASVLQNNSGN
jgi:hypothetical protein